MSSRFTLGSVSSIDVVSADVVSAAVSAADVAAGLPHAVMRAKTKTTVSISDNDFLPKLNVITSCFFVILSKANRLVVK